MMTERHPCAGCSNEGVVPEYVSEYGVTVWWCPACAERDLDESKLEEAIRSLNEQIRANLEQAGEVLRQLKDVAERLGWLEDPDGPKP